jgi:hypothetical protein
MPAQMLSLYLFVRLVHAHRQLHEEVQEVQCMCRMPSNSSHRKQLYVPLLQGTH